MAETIYWYDKCFELRDLTLETPFVEPKTDDNWTDESMTVPAENLRTCKWMFNIKLDNLYFDIGDYWLIPSEDLLSESGCVPGVVMGWAIPKSGTRLPHIEALWYLNAKYPAKSDFTPKMNALMWQNQRMGRQCGECFEDKAADMWCSCLSPERIAIGAAAIAMLSEATK